MPLSRLSLMPTGCWPQLLALFPLASPDYSSVGDITEKGRLRPPPAPKTAECKSLCILTPCFQLVAKIGKSREDHLADPCFGWAIFSFWKTEPIAAVSLTFPKGIVASCHPPVAALLIVMSVTLVLKAKFTKFRGILRVCEQITWCV